MSAVCLITGIVVPFLPETRHDTLPETIEEVENLGKTKPTVKVKAKPGEGPAEGAGVALVNGDSL